jgi:hypothetical protein
VTESNIKPALLTRTEIDYLQNKIQVSDGYQRKIKSDIRRKMRIFNELELPLLLKSGLITATANCNSVTSNCNNISLENLSNSANNEIQTQNMVGRKGLT